MKANHRFKFAGIMSTALLLFSPISGAFAGIAQANAVHADDNSTWDYDTDNPGLGEYDHLLQHAGPSDGAVEWYPAQSFKNSSKINPSLLVKQLVDLSIATNDSNSNARYVLFNDTTGDNKDESFKQTYSKYNLALGFIAQILDFKSQKTGEHVFLRQGFESKDGIREGAFTPEDKDENGFPPEKIRHIPRPGEGVNISQILGDAIFGDPTKAYAQLYINGYDNVTQNAENIIRETTSSITIVAQSSISGKKATAIFKLNNKSFNTLPDMVLLGNLVDHSPHFSPSGSGSWSAQQNPDTSKLGDSAQGTFNQTENLTNGLTQDQKNILGSSTSSAWVDPNSGSGTIVVPRGTSAKVIASQINKLKYQSNFTINNIAPMKAIHGDNFNANGNSQNVKHGYGLVTNTNSYNVLYGEEGSASSDNLYNSKFPNILSIENDILTKYLAVSDPRLQNGTKIEEAGDESKRVNVSNTNFSNSLLYRAFNTDVEITDYDNSTAAKIPDQERSIHAPRGASNSPAGKNFDDGRDPWLAYLDDGHESHARRNFTQFKNLSGGTLSKNLGVTTYPFGGKAGYGDDVDDSQPAVAFGGGNNISIKLENKKDNGVAEKLGDVVHAFEPAQNSGEKQSPFMVREAWDSMHTIFGNGPIPALSEDEIAKKIANNGSFNDASGSKIKKSFTFDMPLNNSVMKSYRNPYSTVISTALPFSKGITDFKAGNDYNTVSGDMNEDLANDNKAGKYSADINQGFNGSIATNPWYINRYEPGESSSYIDGSGHPINLYGNGGPIVSGKSLHISRNTWESGTKTGSTGDEPGLYNIGSTHGTPTFSSSYPSDVTDFSAWITNNGAQHTSSDVAGNYRGSGTERLVGNVRTNEGPHHLYTANTTDKIPADNKNIPDANNNNTYLAVDASFPVKLSGSSTGRFYPNLPDMYLTGTTGWSKYQIPAPQSNLGMDSVSKNWHDTWKGHGESNDSVKERPSFHTSHSESHLQLAKNIGYVLINATNLSESEINLLKGYQIPAGQSAESVLDGIQNTGNFIQGMTLPYIYPVFDDKEYKGGLIGVMSIKGKNTSVDPNQDAGSYYNNTLTGTPEERLKIPSKNGALGSVVKTDYKVGSDKVTGTVPSGDFVDYITDGGGLPTAKNYIKGQFATETDLHYGLAWNDSADLPQVKIERSHNVQYLVPVSVARTVTTALHQRSYAGYWKEVQRQKFPNSNGSGTHLEYKFGWGPAPQFERWVTTEYHDYQMFLGNVKLEGRQSPSSNPQSGVYDAITNPGSATSDGNKTNNFIDGSGTSLKELLPVNNQIVYSMKGANFYPHYDSELFDNGSNTDDVTVTRGDAKPFIGTSTEKETSPDTIGSSDDYSIGIVRAPEQFFEYNTSNNVPKRDRNGKLIGKSKVIKSTENAAINTPGINATMDTDANDNGMAISDPNSYATLENAYNVNIKDGKAYAKEGDTSSNKGARVQLVQQLLDNGGSKDQFYYIPSLPRLLNNWNTARINVVIYDKAAVPAPTKKETKPSFSTTDVSGGNDPFNVKFRPYTTTYDDGAVLNSADVPQNFKNLLSKVMTAGNPDLVDGNGQVATTKLQDILVGAFLGSWQQNDGSFDQTDSKIGVNSPLYLYGGFGISNSDTKNSYKEWPKGYADGLNVDSSDYKTAINRFPGDFYRGGKDLLNFKRDKIANTAIPSTALKADVSKVDVSKAGTYPVVFTYTNPSNADDFASITVPITISEQSTPVFAFQGSNDATIRVGETFDKNQYKVVGSWTIFNNYGGDYNKLVNYEGIAKNSDGTPQVTIIGDVDTNTPGIYQLTYKATSTTGATATMTRNITVLPKEDSSTDKDKPSEKPQPTEEWTVRDHSTVGYINYVPGYGINVWNAPAGKFTGQRLAHGTAWKIFKKATNAKGDTFYNVGRNQWIDGKYVSFTPVNKMEPMHGVVRINYVPGYGVNLWKEPNTTGGAYDRKLPHNSEWRVHGKQNGFYNVGTNQWIQGDYAVLK